jgi:hypothetical protein
MFGLVDAAENKVREDWLISWEQIEWKSLETLLLSKFA